MFDPTSQQNPGITPQGNRARARGESVLLVVLAWSFILLMVAIEMLTPVLLPLISPHTATRAQLATANPTNVEFELLARFHLGAKRFFDSNKQAAPTSATVIGELQAKMRTAVDAIHLVPLAFEFGDTATAMRELDSLLEVDGLPVELRRDARALETIYRLGGPDELDDEARTRLLSRHKWFAELALAHGKPDTDPHRQAADGLATRTFAGMLLAIAAVGSLGLVAIFLSVGLIILLAMGKVRSAYQLAVPSSPGLLASLRLEPPAPRPRDSAIFVAPADMLGDPDRLSARPVEPRAVALPPASPPGVTTEPPLNHIFDNAPTDVSVTVPLEPVRDTTLPEGDDLFSRKPDDGHARLLGMSLPPPPPVAFPQATPAPQPVATPLASADPVEPAAPAQPPARRGPYIEAFAIYMVTFFGFSLALAFGFPRTPLSAIWLYLPIAVAVAAWPLLRGVKWDEFRRAIGLHRGRGVISEVLCGLGGYLAGVPLLVAGFIVMFILVKTQQFLVDNWPSSPGVTHVAPASAPTQPPDDAPPAATVTPARESVITAEESNFAAPNATPQRNAMPSHPIINEIKPGSGITGFIALFLLAAVWAPFSEEFFFRGLLYHHLRGRLGWVISAVIVGIIFAAVHPQGWTAIPVLGSMAFIFAGIREWRGSLIGSITAHAFNNGMLILFMYLVLG